MTYSIPPHGKTDWDVETNANLQYLKDTAEAAETPAGAQAKATAAQNAAISAAATDATNKANAAQAAAATDATTKANTAEANAKAASTPIAHATDTGNPHSVTKAQVGLGNVPNVDATARANHTGTQLSSTISDLDSGVASQVTSGPLTKAALDSSYGSSSSWRGQWTPGTYSPGNLVASGNYMVTPRSITSDEPSPSFTTDGSIDGTGWNRFNVASATGGIVTFVNATTNSAATAFGKTAFDTSSLVSVSGDLWITGSADGLQMGIFDSAATQGAGATGQALRTLSGFYGIDFNIYNNRVDWVINGVPTTGPSFGPSVVRTDGTNFDTRSIEYRPVGGGQVVLLYKGTYQSPSFTPPANAVLAFGGRSGGQSGTFKVQGSPTLQTFSTNWRRLALLVDIT